MGFHSRLCTPEHPESNRIAEQFMSVIAKTVHAAIAEGKDPQVEVRRRLMNYRNTQHRSIGKALSELMQKNLMGILQRTKVTTLVKPARGKYHDETKRNER